MATKRTPCCGGCWYDEAPPAVHPVSLAMAQGEIAPVVSFGSRGDAGPRRLAGSWISPEKTARKVAGCRASCVWWEASDRFGTGEPVYWLWRRDDYHGPRVSFTDGANKILTRFLAAEIQRRGGFDAVWAALFPATLHPAGERRYADELRRRADLIERRAELTEMAAEGLLTFTPVPAKLVNRDADRLPTFKMFGRGEHGSRSAPTELAMLNGEQVGWLVDNTVVPMGEES